MTEIFRIHSIEMSSEAGFVVVTFYLKRETNNPTLKRVRIFVLPKELSKLKDEEWLGLISDALSQEVPHKITFLDRLIGRHIPKYGDSVK